LAGQTVAAQSVSDQFSMLLDSPEIAAPCDELDAARWTGRKGYGTRALSQSSSEVKGRSTPTRFAGSSEPLRFRVPSGEGATDHESDTATGDDLDANARRRAANFSAEAVEAAG
jgi:hypothetical protein